MFMSKMIGNDLQRGVALVEVMVTIVILAFGLLGLAGLQAKIQLAEVESYQRAQAIALLTDISERINANRALAASYIVTSIGDAACPSAGTTIPGKDLNEWCNALKGAAEAKGSANVGAMVGARGCITELQAVNNTAGSCATGIYLVSVAWQGLHQTVAPTVTCGQGSYGTDSYRRAISTRVVVGTPGCV